MAEFTSELKRAERPVAIYIMIAVVAIAVVGVGFVWHYQKNLPKPTGSPVVIPDMVRPGEPDFEAYKNKVRIENVKAYIGFNFAGNRLAMIDGTLSNEGSRKLEALELHITLYDVYNKLCKDVTRTVLRPGLGLENRPMEPLEKRTFTASIESVDQLWNPKRVEIEITGLKYK